MLATVSSKKVLRLSCASSADFWHNPRMASLSVFCVAAPGAREFTALARDWPGWEFAAVVGADAPSPTALEAALLTGLAPEFHEHARPFWQRAGAAADVQTRHEHPQHWRAQAADATLVWRSPDASLDALKFPAGACAIVTLPANDYGLLLVRGLELPKPIIGVLEIAHLFERVLTGERLHDEI